MAEPVSWNYRVLRANFLSFEKFGTINFLNFRTQEYFAVINLKFK